MGCSESSNVAEAVKKVQRVEQLQNSTLLIKKGQEKMHYLLGHINEDDQLFAKVSLTNRTINRLSIPQGFEPMNFSSMLEIDNKHFFISGGINNSMNHISSDSYMYDSSNHSIKSMGKMNQARYTHAAILFGGNVYAIGGRYFGEDEQAILSTCQRYSIEHNKWNMLANLNIKRCTCFVVQWKNTIYVLGGYTGVFQRSQKIERYHEKIDKWEIVPFQLNRGIQSAFVYSNKPNQLLIFGGNTNSGPTASVISLNLYEETVQSHKKLKQQKTLHKSYVFNDEIFIFGGSQKLNLQIYNLLTQKSQIIDIKLSEQYTQQNFEILTMSQCSLKVQFFEQKITNISSSEEDQIVILFGTTDQPFILQINVSIPSCSFHAVPLGLKLYANSGGVNINRLDYILFGGIEDDSLSCVSSDVYGYNHSTKEVKKMASMITQRYAFAYLHIQGKIFAIGGGNSDVDGNLNVLQACEYYSIDSNCWKMIANLPTPLISSMCLEHKNSLYVFGGISDAGKRNKSIIKYDNIKDNWSELIFHLPFGIQSAFVYHYKPSEFYIFGGRIDNGDSNGIWSLIFAQDSSSECSFYQKGQTAEKKSGLKIFKPQQQNFFVSFGGEVHIINYYDVDTLKILNQDGLRRLNDVFLQQVSTLNSQSMQKYLSICKQK